MRNGDEGMRYDVQRQVDDIDKALAILGLREIPNMNYCIILLI